MKKNRKYDPIYQTKMSVLSRLWIPVSLRKFIHIHDWIYTGGEHEYIPNQFLHKCNCGKYRYFTKII